MMDISILQIKQLRAQTGSGFMECKKALQKANGNIENAVDYLRTLGICIADRNISHHANCGRIFLYQDKNLGVLLELNSETDFVANNDEFKIFGQKIVDYIGTKKLFNLQDIRDFFNSQNIALIAKVRENIIIRRIKYLIGSVTNSYLHLGKIGVVVTGKILSDMNDYKYQCFKHVAMHIASSRPLFLFEKDIPQDILDRETQVQQSIANKTGKNSYVLKSIVNGRLKKFINNITLVHQKFIMDPKITVGDFLNKNSISIQDFIYFKVGESL
ncbi:Elongation factor Ts [Buchnera aphidicola (Cinara splendens)]|uniref:Elongation factor Ts n=2 Tax=Buchnera aphidicola TaxID=9 RepID=A0A451DE35_9GAMM|nr:Elongation factor Ts [Buchnera aphidicola (Cinara splendens)]